MLKNLVKISILLITFSSLGYTEPIEQLCRELEKGLKEKDVKKLAVMSFPYHNGRISEGSTIIQERVTTFLVKRGRFEVIERNLLDKVINELKLEVSGIIDSDSAQQIGKILGVNALVIGTLNDIDSENTEINARIVFVETGKILSAGQVTIKRTWKSSPVKPIDSKTNKKGDKKSFVQLALLLDTSNSMDGLIAQAKSQLWKIVNELASAEVEGQNPIVEVALYEYGNDNLSPGENYLRQVLPFSSDLDLVSEKLFSLTTRGGSEFCGAVIQDAVRNLSWYKDEKVYRAIFIAGNEPFSQGPIDFRDSIKEAVGKNIIVNTIFCGPLQEGINTKWSEGAKIGNGDYMNIEASRDVVVIQTPYDDEITKQGSLINQTYIPYGREGKEYAQRQERIDALAMEQKAAGASVERALFKSKTQYADVAVWDLVSLYEQGKIEIKDIKKDLLPEELKKLNNSELEDYLKKKISERKSIQEKINALNDSRKKYIIEQSKNTDISNTLDKAIIDIVRKQAGKKNLKFK